MKKLIGLFMLALMGLSSTASAGNLLIETKITQMLIARDNATVWIYVDPSIDLDVLAQAAAGTGTTCHKHAQIYNKSEDYELWAEWGNYVAFKVTRFLGSEYLNALSMAFAANKTVTISTTDVTEAGGGCADLSTTLTLNYFKIKY